MKKMNLFISNFNSFKKITVVILSSFLVLFLVEAIYLKTMKSVNYDSIGKINAVINEELDCNLTIWGSSTAKVNIDTKLINEKLNISVMNMGFDGTNIDQYYGLACQYLSYTKKSKFMIFVLDYEGALIKRDKFYNIHEWIHNFDNRFIFKSFSDIDPKECFKIKNLPFYSFLYYNKHSFPYFRKQIFNCSKDYFFPYFGYHPNGVIFNSKKIEKFDSRFDERPFKKIREICNTATKKNIQPILVLMPFFSLNDDFRPNKDQLIKKLNNLDTAEIKIWNFMDDTISKDTSFYNDYAHFNIFGAENFTKKLIFKLKENFNIYE